MALPPIRTEILRRPPNPGQRRIVEALRTGCYLIDTTITDSAVIDESQVQGSLRIERVLETEAAVHFQITGDLYSAPASPRSSIPVFRRDSYQLYLSLSESDNDDSRSLRFQGDRLRIELRCARIESGGWASVPRITIILALNAPPGFDFSVEIRRGASVIGAGTLSWRESAFRELTILPACTYNGVAPSTNGSGASWESVFRAAGWKLTIAPVTVIAANSDSWTLADLHSTLTTLPESGRTLDEQWYVHLLCVKSILANNDQQRGVMFDFGEFDSNRNPRQGVAIAFGWPVPNLPAWGTAAGRQFGEALPLYFRTAVHEVGHALGLTHPTTFGEDNLMTTTDDLVGHPRFPAHLSMSYSKNERTLLCHQPDPIVRPGGLPFPNASFVSDGHAKGPRGVSSVKLGVAPLLDTVPFAAPVRIQLVMTTLESGLVEIPERMGFAQGQIEVLVQGPDGVLRSVTSGIVICSGLQWVRLEAGVNRYSALTLFRNGQGPLFPDPGRYTIRVRIPVRRGTRRTFVEGAAQVLIIKREAAAHRRVEERLLGAPAIQQLLVVGGELDRTASLACAAGLKDEVLRPHFEYLEAKRVGSCSHRRNGNLVTMSKVLSQSTIMTHCEIERAIEIVATCIMLGSRAFVSASKILEILTLQIDNRDYADSIKGMLHSKRLEVEKSINR